MVDEPGKSTKLTRRLVKEGSFGRLRSKVVWMSVCTFQSIKRLNWSDEDGNGGVIGSRVGMLLCWPVGVTF